MVKAGTALTFLCIVEKKNNDYEKHRISGISRGYEDVIYGGQFLVFMLFYFDNFLHQPLASCSTERKKVLEQTGKLFEMYEQQKLSFETSQRNT